jgi:hypothetical protein
MARPASCTATRRQTAARDYSLPSLEGEEMKAAPIAILLACTAVSAQAKPTSAVSAEEQAEAANAKDEKAPAAKKPDFDMAAMFAMFDKLFPASPEPPAEKLARSRLTAAAMFPDGTYASMFDEMMSGMVDRVLNMSAADLETDPAKRAKANRSSLREAMSKDDPHFQERMTIMRKVIGEELGKISGLIEPKLREGLARSIARRFGDRQLQEINAFLATDSGKALGRESMKMWVDPDVMRGMFASFPELFMAMPAAMQRIEGATAHLPKPKKIAAEKKADDAKKK